MTRKRPLASVRTQTTSRAWPWLCLLPAPAPAPPSFGGRPSVHPGPHWSSAVSPPEPVPCGNGVEGGDRDAPSLRASHPFSPLAALLSHCADGTARLRGVNRKASWSRSGRAKNDGSSCCALSSSWGRRRGRDHPHHRHLHLHRLHHHHHHHHDHHLWLCPHFLFLSRWCGLGSGELDMAVMVVETHFAKRSDSAARVSRRVVKLGRSGSHSKPCVTIAVGRWAPIVCLALGRCFTWASPKGL